MNNGFTPEKYAEIVNVYGSRLRAIAPEARIVACGQKRSNDMIWSQKVIDLAGKNFDVLGVHNYEYEPENFETGLRRIRDYLSKLRDYIRASAHPRIEIGVLEWNLSRTYDWRAGLHAAGSLILYEQLSPGLTMSCPALLMRNTTDDPTWTSFIYHDHVSWFPGVGLPVEKLFRAHYAERYLASTSGTFRDIPDRKTLLRRDRDHEAGRLAARYRRRHRDRERRRPPDRDQGRQLRSGSGTPCSCGSRAPGVPEKAVARLAHDQRRADGFRVPRASGCDRPGESNAELREGPHRGPGALHGCRGRDPGEMKAWARPEATALLKTTLFCSARVGACATFSQRVRAVRTVGYGRLATSGRVPSACRFKFFYRGRFSASKGSSRLLRQVWMPARAPRATESWPAARAGSLC